MTEPLDLPIAALAEAVRHREIAPTELVEMACARIRERDGPLNAVVHADADGARRSALAVELALQRPGGPMALAGIPFAVKGGEPVRRWPSTSGDPRAPAVVSEHDSPQVARLRQAGGIPLAAANAGLYGVDADTANPAFGVTSNPWDRARTPGGSSGGPAVAVSAAMVSFATGSDGGGSIRVPAAACGIVGLRPTSAVAPHDAGEPPRWGGLAVRASLARTVRDLAILLDAVCRPFGAGQQGTDVPGFVSAIARGAVTGLRVAWSPTLGYATPSDDVLATCAAAARRLEAAGAIVMEVDSVVDLDPLDIFTVPFVLGIASEVRAVRGGGSLAGLDGRFEGWLEQADSLTDADVAESDAARERLRRAFDGVFARCDVLLTPTTAQPPPARPYPGNEWVQYTHPFNLIDSPALSIPAGVVVRNGISLPVGIQVAGPPMADRAVVAAGAILEDLLSLDLHPPKTSPSPHPRRPPP